MSSSKCTNICYLDSDATGRSALVTITDQIAIQRQKKYSDKHYPSDTAALFDFMASKKAWIGSF